MRRVTLGQPLNEKDGLRWAMGALRDIERASDQDNPFDVFDLYTVANPPPPVRTLDAATATTADIVAVFATLLNDMKRRGANRVE